MKVVIETGISLATVTKWDRGIAVNAVLADRIEKEVQEQNFTKEAKGKKASK